MQDRLLLYDHSCSRLKERLSTSRTDGIHSRKESKREKEIERINLRLSLDHFSEL